MYSGVINFVFVPNIESSKEIIIRVCFSFFFFLFFVPTTDSSEEFHFGFVLIVFSLFFIIGTIE